MQRDEILINCIDDIHAGRYSLEDGMAAHPDLADELKALCSIRCGINPEEVVAPSEFKQRARARLIAEMESTRPGHYEAIRSRLLSLFAAPARTRGVAAVVGMLLVIIIGSGGTVYASRNALPDDTLYPVKKLVENLQIAATFSAQSKANLHLKFAERRIDEVREESTQETEISASALKSLAKHLDSAVKHAGELPDDDAVAFLPRLYRATQDQQSALKDISSAMPASSHSQNALKQAIDVTWRGTIIARAASGDPSFLDTAPSVRDEGVESAYFEIEGTLMGTGYRDWNVGGVRVGNVHGAPGVPDVGQGIKLKGLVTSNKILLTEVEDRDEWDDEPDHPVKIEGIFNGANEDGTVWSVGGIRVGEIREVLPPAKGDRVKLGGISRGGVFTITEMNDRVREDSERERSDDREEDRRSERPPARDTDDSQMNPPPQPPGEPSREQPSPQGAYGSKDEPDRDDVSPDRDQESSDPELRDEPPPNVKVESPEEQEPGDPLENKDGEARDEQQNRPSENEDGDSREEEEAENTPVININPVVTTAPTASLPESTAQEP